MGFLKMRNLLLSRIFVSFLLILPLGTTAKSEISQTNDGYLKALAYLKNQQPESACIIISEVLKINEVICQGNDIIEFTKSIKSVDNKKYSLLHLLGISLRKLNYFEQAHIALEASKSGASGSDEFDDISLSLANLDQGLYRRAVNLYKSTLEAKSELAAKDEIYLKAQSALNNYQALWHSKSFTIQVKSKLNWLLIFSSIDLNLQKLTILKQKLYPIVNTVIHEIEVQLPNLSYSEQIESQIKLSEALLKLSQNDLIYLKEADKQAEDLLELSKRSKIPRDLSKAYGLKGKILLLKSMKNEAIVAFKKAEVFAQTNQSYDLAYQWEWELGKIYSKAGKHSVAIKKYQDTIQSIERVRKDLFSLKPDLQFTFRDEIEPIFNEYISLLFEDSQPDLRKVININNDLKITEIENYLQCGKLNLVNLLDVKEKISPEATIYLVSLPNRYEVILKQKNGTLKHFSTSKQIINLAAENIKRNVQNSTFSNYSETTSQESFAQLYNQIISPIKRLLPDKGTIVFSLDSNLRDLPWGMLFDGQKYFIEKYSIGLTLGSKLESPDRRSIDYSRTKPLLIGLSQSNSSEFPNLPYVTDEISSIQSLFSSSKVLLNNAFTTEKLLNNSQDFSIIHIASHGEFSSDPEKTFILSWDQKLKVQEMTELVNNRKSPIDLLVLSGCETAAGDRRASLGIAGAAVQSGAASVLASLWIVNDKSQGLLMSAFYKNLIHGENKAEALRKAQLSLLKSDQWASGYFWGSMVLVGSWR